MREFATTHHFTATNERRRTNSHAVEIEGYPGQAGNSAEELAIVENPAYDSSKVGTEM